MVTKSKKSQPENISLEERTKVVLPKANYVEAVGRRKTSTARVRIYQNSKENQGKIVVNNKALEDYFPMAAYRLEAIAPLEKMGMLGNFFVSVQVKGGGISSQAGAIAHGIARALVEIDPSLKKKLRSLGFITRDPRMVERKKYGLKKARRAPQWSKR
ncbi:MAG: 30S ribosomal protein S9 [Patescibacteria group bacterium]|nr:30S ribosomal protein S9 [Patescibacteria group bacterium]